MQDQPARLMMRMRIAQFIHDAWRAWRAVPVDKKADFANDHPEYFAIVDRYLAMQDEPERT
ncbi:MAG: hypothetical protein C0391_03930 [Anaerolinea sp.]|nr:hypothetical protein [Anaerolinea sp.]